MSSRTLRIGCERILESSRSANCVVRANNSVFLEQKGQGLSDDVPFGLRA
ncbi:MAG: hypothetical protein AAFP04_16055 [Myxococcota bacterium]